MILSLIIGVIFVVAGIFLNAYEEALITLHIKSISLTFDAESLGIGLMICGAVVPVFIFLAKVIMLAVSNI